MNISTDRTRSWLAALVLLHLGISIVHGTAHQQAQITMSAAATTFVFAVILAGPLVGLLLLWPARRLGAGLIALTLAGAFVFGVVNHFLLASPDHVSHVDANAAPLFGATAVLLAITEALGSGLAWRAARAGSRSTALSQAAECSTVSSRGGAH